MGSQLPRERGPDHRWLQVVWYYVPSALVMLDLLVQDVLTNACSSKIMPAK